MTRILSLVGISDFAAPWFTDAVKRRGSRVHETIALFVDGTLDEDALDPALVPYLDGFTAYLRDTHAEVEFSEQIVGGLDFGYAGTLDLIVRTHDPATGRTRRALVDIKPALYPGVGVQTAAYQHAAYALYPGTPVVLARAALVLPGDGSYRYQPLEDATDTHVFQAALRIVQWRHQYGGLSWAA